MAVVIGVDSSTQSTKAQARDLETGRVLATGTAAHPPTQPPVSEQDPAAWWRALVQAIAGLGTVRDDAVAISIAGQQHGLVLVDSAGQAVRPAKLWNDTTSAREADELVRSLGAQTWAQGCGSVPVAAFTVTKLAWVATHEPAALAATAKVMLPHDYLTWRLTGHHVTDRGDASGTGWFDPTTGDYSADLFGAALGDPLAAGEWLDRLPRVLAPTEAAATIAPGAAAELGLGAATVVGPGTGDNMAAALGLGLGSGDIAVSLGTSGTVYAVSPTSTRDPSGAVAGFADAAGGFLPLVCTLNATGVTDTVADWLGTDPTGLAELALGAQPDRPGPVLVPYFDGERTPNLPDASGSWLGLRRGTTREQMARAAHDGVLCGLLAGLDRLVECGVRADGTLHLIGGGANSAAYRQRCADLHGAPITVPDADQAVAAGAALQAAAVAQSAVTGDLHALAQAWDLGAGPTVEPHPASAPAAAQVRDAYTGATRSG